MFNGQQSFPHWFALSSSTETKKKWKVAGYCNLCCAFSLRSNEKWAQQQVATGNLYSSPSFTCTEHCAEAEEPDALKKWSVYKCVCVSRTRVCKASWLSSLLHLLNLIKHPSNSLVPLPTPITHTYVHTHTYTHTHTQSSWKLQRI